MDWKDMTDEERRATLQLAPHPTFVGGNCACDPINFCLWHYGKLSAKEQETIKRQVGIYSLRMSF